MKKILSAFSFLVFSMSAFSQTGVLPVSACVLPGTQANVSGIMSTNYQQGIIPQCTVTVYLTGTTTLAITTPQSPFTANTNGSIPPINAAINQGYDVMLSGGVSPNTYSSPVTITGLYPAQAITAGCGLGSPCAAAQGGTGAAGTLTGIPYANGASAWTISTSSQIGVAVAAYLATLTGCSTANNFYSPGSGNCQAAAGFPDFANTSGSNILRSSVSATTPDTYAGGQDASSNAAMGYVVLRGANQTGTGLLSSAAAGGALVTGGSNASTHSASQSGSVEITPGYSSGGGQQGVTIIGQAYKQGTGSHTQWSLQCLDTTNQQMADDCGANPTSILGVTDMHTGSAVQVHIPPSITPITASAAVTLGDTVCAGSTAGKVTDSGGTGLCSSGVTVGVVVATTGSWTFADGNGTTVSTTLPLVQMWGISPNSGSGSTASVKSNMPSPFLSSSSGRPMPVQVIALLGNSLVSNDTAFAGELCSEISGGTLFAPAYMQGHRCVTSTQISVDSSNNVTLTVPNSDSYFAVNDRFTVAGGQGGVDGGCLFDSYVVTAATSTTITFATAGSALACPPESITAGAVTLTRSVVKFGINGGTLDAWYASSGNYGFAPYQSWAQAAVAAGQVPITIMVDAGIMTNSTRLAQVPIAGFESDLAGVLTAMQGIAVTPPGGSTTTMKAYPLIVTTGNPNACNTTTTGVATAPCSGGTNTGSGGVYAPPTQITGTTQYVFPYGTTGSQFATPATITSGSISAGANTVTINPCIPEVWGGPGDAIPTLVDPNGYLRRNGSLIQVVLDTSGSGVREVVNLTSVVPTGASGLNGFQTCNISFTSAFAHAASTQVIATELTADQQYTNWKLEIPYQVQATYPGNVQVVDTLSAIGRAVSNPVGAMANELHPASGYSIMAGRDLAQVSSYFTVPLKAAESDPLETQYDTGLYAAKRPSFDLSFDVGAAAQARINANSINSGAFYAKSALDPALFYPTAIGSMQGIGTNFIRLGLPTPTSAVFSGDVQTGDQLYHSDCGSWQPATLSGGTYSSSGVVQYSLSGTQPAMTCAAGRVMVMASYFVDAAQGAKFLAHPMTWPLSGVYNMTVGTSSTNNLVLSLQGRQNPFVIGGENLNCSQVSVQAGDWIVVAGNAPNAYGTAGTSFVLPSTGTWNSATCTWTDTSGTNYSTYNGKLANLVQQYRAPDAAFNTVTLKTLNILTLTPTAGVTLGTTSTPSFSTAAYIASSTGGNCANGTTYTFGTALLSTAWGSNAAHAGPIHTSTFSYNPASGSTNQIGYYPSTTVPSGYNAVYYLLISGTYYAVSVGQGQTTCPATGSGLTVANSVDQTNSGFTGASFNPSVLNLAVAGTTAGTYQATETFQGTAQKEALVYLNGYENATATAQTVTLPSSFATVGYVETVGGTCTGVTISGATLTLPSSMGATQTGLCRVTGW
jgi:hypothetical protein